MASLELVWKDWLRHFGAASTVPRGSVSRVETNE